MEWMKTIILSGLPVIQTELEETVSEVATAATEAEKSAGGSAGWIIAIIAMVVALLALGAAVFFFSKSKGKGAPKKTKNKEKVIPPKANGKEKKNSVNKVSTTPEKGHQKVSGIREENSAKEDINRNDAIYPEVILSNIDNPGSGYRHRIVDKIMIGRAEGSDIRIATDAAVSSRHCMISVKGTQFYLEDCNSSNGTYYNDVEVTSQVPIMSGGILEIGHDRYRLTLGK